MKDRFTVRKAARSDVEVLRALIEASVRGLQREYTEAQREGALGHALGLDTQLIEDGTYFVAAPVDEPGAVAGCGGWSFRRTLFGSDGAPHRASEPMTPGIDAAKIRAIFVHPGWARRGLGTQLLRHCEAAARTAGFTRAEMGSTLTGVPLYEREGYARCGEVMVPLPNEEMLAVVRMEKGLVGAGRV